MILCLGTTPAVQRVMVFRRLALDAVNRAAQTLDGAAGKSINTAKVLRALGERPVATGFLGGAPGEFIRSTLQASGVELDFVTVDAPTRQCITVIDDAAQTHTELVEESRAVPHQAYEQLAQVVRRRADQCRAVVMSGTITPGGPVDLYATCARLAGATGALTAVDAQGPPLREALGVGPGLVKPNRAELAATVGRDLPDELSVQSAMRELHERGAARVVVTAGREPSLAYDGRRFWRVTGPRIQAANPIGSGDSFTAGLVWRLLRGDDLGEACRWGQAAGTANALTLMPGDLSASDVERLSRQMVVELL
jgi:tagatose 6-phosphate kinase